MPDLNEEYFLYQSLDRRLAARIFAAPQYAEFVCRIQAYMVKALHEAKVHSTWVNPNADYDDGVRNFVGAVLDRHANACFLDDFRLFQKRISHLGMLNSLSQTLLKIAAPGVPDTYQGTELWDFSLVDPDNRRPVNYDHRRHILDELQTGIAANQKELARELIKSKQDARIKLFITWQALCCRRANPGLFSTGAYQPLETAGGKHRHLFSFIRRQGDLHALVAVPRLIAHLDKNSLFPHGDDVWQDTYLLLPDSKSDLRYRNIFTGERMTPTTINGHLALTAASVFADLPVALLITEA